MGKLSIYKTNIEYKLHSNNKRNQIHMIQKEIGVVNFFKQLIIKNNNDYSLHRYDVLDALYDYIVSICLISLAFY